MHKILCQDRKTDAVLGGRDKTKSATFENVNRAYRRSVAAEMKEYGGVQ